MGGTRHRTKNFAPPVLAVALAVAFQSCTSAAVIDDAADLGLQQQQEKKELEEMRREMEDIAGSLTESARSMEELKRQATRDVRPREIQLTAREGTWEAMPGAFVTGATYDGQVPGPLLRIKEGELIRIVLNNQLKVPTSLALHGMILPQSVAGLPRQGAGMVAPGEKFAYQFFAHRPGTYWYHPQVVHGDQLQKGMYGAIVVEPVNVPRTYERDVILMFGEAEASVRQAGSPAAKRMRVYLANGKCAPANERIEVKQGERMRLRMVNASRSALPLFLSGHRLEIVAVNGSQPTEPYIVRDTITLQPGDRVDAEFTADNPGVWALASLVPEHNSNDGKFPGGIATVLRYVEVLGK